MHGQNTSNIHTCVAKCSISWDRTFHSKVNHKLNTGCVHNVVTTWSLWLGRPQLATLGTKERARLGWPFFGLEIFILKTMMFREVETVLNEREHFKMLIRSVLDYISLILSRTE
jgi:hypothetical protein